MAKSPSRDSALDLSRARPGDRLVVTVQDVIEMGRENELELREQLMGLRERGICTKTWRDEDRQEVVIELL